MPEYTPTRQTATQPVQRVWAPISQTGSVWSANPPVPFGRTNTSQYRAYMASSNPSPYLGPGPAKRKSRKMSRKQRKTRKNRR